MKSIDQKIIEEANEWLSDQGQPSYEKLRRLAEMKAPEARELLYELADSYNVHYDDTTSPREVAEKIMIAMREGETVEGL